jgi:hypothetical protein
MAADVCSRYPKLSGLLPILERRRSIESNAIVKRGIDFSIAMLRDGFRVTPSEHAGEHFLTVMTTPGRLDSV